MYYAIRSRKDGQYLTARPHDDRPDWRYLLIFKQDFEALGYLSAHAGDLSDRFATEAITPEQLKQTLDRLGFQGVGLVTDALVPVIDFLEKRLL